MRWGSWPYDLVPKRNTFILHLPDPQKALSGLAPKILEITWNFPGQKFSRTKNKF